MFVLLQHRCSAAAEDKQGNGVYQLAETVAVTIHVRDRSLLQGLVRRFGWPCMY